LAAEIALASEAGLDTKLAEAAAWSPSCHLIPEMMSMNLIQNNSTKTAVQQRWMLVQ